MNKYINYLVESYIGVESILQEDIPQIITLAEQILITEHNELVPYKNQMSPYLKSIVDWNISAKLVYEDNIIGFFLLTGMDIPEFNKKATEYSILGNGLHGVGIGIKKEYRGAGFVRRLLRYILTLDYNYIWGASYSFYGLQNSWSKLGEYIGELQGAAVFAKKLK